VRRRRRREPLRELADVPENRILREGVLIGYSDQRAPLYTWWNRETGAWGLFELPR